MDNILRYHDEIEFELKRELAIIRAKNLAYGSLNQYEAQGLFSSSLNPLHFFGTLADERRQDDLDVSGVLFKTQPSMADIAVKIMKQKSSSLNSSMTLATRKLQRRDSNASFQSL